jgi:hypothetical protein
MIPRGSRLAVAGTLRMVTSAHAGAARGAPGDTIDRSATEMHIINGQILD